ncbi:MAG: hypothetical protein Q9222_006362 [Ikaeria aurantiellina]
MKGRPAALRSAVRSFDPPLSSLSTHYICLHCRRRTYFRSNNPLPTQSSATSFSRAYATKPDIADRLHKGFVDYVAPRLFKKGQGPGQDAQGDKETKTVVQDGESNQEQDDGTRATAEDLDYTPAVSGEGLETIGGPTGWWEEAWDEQHQFKGFMRPKPILDGSAARKAIERALLEYYMIQQGSNRFLRNLPAVKKYPWNVPPVEGFNIRQTQDGHVQIKWRSFEDEMVMRRWMRKPVQLDMEAQDVEEVADGTAGGEAIGSAGKAALISSRPEFEESEATASLSSAKEHQADVFEQPEQSEHHSAKEQNTVHDASLDRDVPQRPLEAKHPTGTPKAQKARFNGLQGSIALTDPETKFAIIKRVMQLTGIRIPDPIVQSIDSSQALWNHLAQKPKPKKLAQILIGGRDISPAKKKFLKQKQIPELSTLSNVRILPSKLVPEMNESALGRQKVVEQHLDQHDIPVPFKDAIEEITQFEARRLTGKGRLVEKPEEDIKAALTDMDSQWQLEGVEQRARA